LKILKITDKSDIALEFLAPSDKFYPFYQRQLRALTIEQYNQRHYSINNPPSASIIHQSHYYAEVAPFPLPLPSTSNAIDI
jgi:hypothetical protein